MRRLLGLGAWMLMLLTQAACEGANINGPDQWFVSVLETGDGGSPSIAVGDTVTLSAIARQYNFGPSPGANSDSESPRFRWTVADTSVAHVSQLGTVQAVSPGWTRIQVMFTGPHGGQSSFALIQVVPRTSLVTITLSRDTIFVGDTVRAVGRALDAVGQPVAGAVLQVGADQRLTSLGAEGTSVTSPIGSQMVAPVTVIYRANVAGTIEIDALRPYVRFSQELTARVNLVVLPRP